MFFVKSKPAKFVTFAELPFANKVVYLNECKRENYTYDDFLCAFLKYSEKHYEPCRDENVILARLEKFALAEDWYFLPNSDNYNDCIIFNPKKNKVSGLKLDFDENCVYISSANDVVKIIV